MQISISVPGYARIQGQINGKIERFEQCVSNAVQAAGIATEAGAKQLAPVGTPESTGIKGYKGGRLRSSIKYAKISRLSCRVGTNVQYAPYVEFGTHKMHPKPFLFPASMEAKKALIAELQLLVK